MWSVKFGVWRKQWEVRSVKCGLWSAKCEVWTVNCEVSTVKCEVWGLECEGSSEKWEVRSVKCGVWSLKFGVQRVQCAAWNVECRGKDTVGTGCLWTIGHLCLGNFRRRLARVYVTSNYVYTCNLHTQYYIRVYIYCNHLNYVMIWKPPSLSLAWHMWLSLSDNCPAQGFCYGYGPRVCAWARGGDTKGMVLGVGKWLGNGWQLVGTWRLMLIAWYKSLDGCLFQLISQLITTWHLSWTLGILPETHNIVPFFFGLNGLMFMRFFGVPSFITVYLWLAISHYGLWESPKVLGSYNPIYPPKLGAERCHWPLDRWRKNTAGFVHCIPKKNDFDWGSDYKLPWRLCRR